MNEPSSPRISFAIAANCLVIAVGIYAYVILGLDEDLYYLSVQEDEYVEWASFLAFAIAAVIYVLAAVRPTFDWRLDWFLLGLGAFCLFVALEEISWGQRVFGYRPPEYFLEENFQQEFNLHNIVDSSLRKLALRVVILGYGVVLPVCMLVPGLGGFLRKIGVVAPPLWLAPAYLVTGIAYITYPLRFTGEWVELMLGFCFLFSALALPDQRRDLARVGTSVAMWAAVIVVGIGFATLTRIQRDSDPDNLRAAQSELEALRRDFVARRAYSSCVTHKRLYTFVEQYGEDGLLEGEFAALTQQGLPEDRAEYFLDPWNYAYWIRDNCPVDARGRVTYVYSFGPNRRRDSTKWKIGGDDVVAFIRGAPAEE